MPLVEELVGQLTHDPNVRVYHTRCELSEGREVGVRGDVSELGQFGQLFLEIRGVIKVNVFPYVLMLTKAELFDWGEITPSAEVLLGHLVISQRQLFEESEGEHEAGPISGDEQSHGLVAGLPN